jgi:Protein of unknown function (DUF3987)/Bifunctional DNA primase/polymerase, N-terminal/Primase C terminal 1 (PriCT-1)
VSAATDTIFGNLVEYAVGYLRRGLSTFPICGTLPHSHRDEHGLWVPCADPGKVPLVAWKRFQDELPTEAEVRAWWRRWPDANIGMATGHLSRIVVLDLDGDLAVRTAQGLGYDNGPHAFTGRVGGVHRYFGYRPDEPRNFAKKQGGIDYRGEGGYVVLAPSRHRLGRSYVWGEELGDLDDLPELPWWVNDLAQTASSNGQVLSRGELIDAGERNSRLTSIGGGMRYTGASEDEILEELRRVNAARCRPPLDDTEVRKIAHSVARYEPDTSPRIQSLAVEPEELEEPLPSVPVFPVDALPGVMQRLIASSSLPAALLAGAYLASTAIAIGGNVEAYYEQFFVERLNLFVGLVGKPGSGKSESQKQPLRPVQRWDAERFRDYRAERERWLNRSNEQKKLDKENGVREPRDPRILVGSATIEATEHRFMAQPSLGIYRDELVGFLKQVNGRYRQKGDDDTDWVLERWDGAPILTDRRGMGGPNGANGILIYVERPTLVILGSIQPSRQRHLGVDTEGGRSRWSLFMVEGNVETVMRNPSPADIEVYERTITRLLTWRQSSRRWLISAPVKRRLDELGEEWAARARGGQASPTTLASLMKATRQVVRYALDIAEFERAVFETDQPAADQTLTVEVLDRAAQIVNYTVAVWDAVGDGTPFARTSALGHLDEPIPHILQYLEHVGGGPIPTWQLYRHHVGGITSRKDLDPVLVRYAERYPGTVADEPSPPGGGRPSQSIRLPLRKP